MYQVIIYGVQITTLRNKIKKMQITWRKHTRFHLIRFAISDPAGNVYITFCF